MLLSLRNSLPHTLKLLAAFEEVNKVNAVIVTGNGCTFTGTIQHLFASRDNCDLEACSYGVRFKNSDLGVKNPFGRHQRLQAEQSLPEPSLAIELGKRKI